MGIGRDAQKWKDVGCWECKFGGPGGHDACDAVPMDLCGCRAEGHPENDPWKGKTRGEANG